LEGAIINTLIIFLYGNDFMSNDDKKNLEKTKQWLYTIRGQKFEKEEGLPNSFIDSLFDQFRIKNVIKELFKFLKITSTPQLIDGLIIFTYFLFVFAFLGVIKWEINIAIFTLLVIGVATLLEIVVANTSFLKRRFSNDEKAKFFLENIDSMTDGQIRYNLKIINFSSENIMIFLNKVEINPDKIPGYVIEEILNNNELTKANKDLLFTPAILKNLKDSFVISLLLQYRNELTKENITNLYSVFNKNDDILKFIFATQVESDVLIRDNSGNKVFVDCYDKYQRKKIQYDFWLKLISFRGINRIETLFIFVIIIGAMLLGAQILNFPLTSLNTPTLIPIASIFSVFLFPFLIASMINGIILSPLFNFLREWHLQHLKEKILSVDNHSKEEH
jgi:hypothetical protein